MLGAGAGGRRLISKTTLVADVLQGNSAEMTAADEAARILLEIKAAYAYDGKEPFVFTSGRKSPVYVDIRKLIAFPRARARLMDMAVEKIERAAGYESVDAIAGGETAGIPFAAWIAERMGLPMLYVRKQPKGFGRMAQIEGALQEGQNVVLVEDLATDGGSKLNFVNALTAAGAKCAHCFVVFHYGNFPTSRSGLRELGVDLHELATWEDILRVAEADGYFPPNVVQEVRRFLAAPDDWAPEEG
jgi:orotate phosphoribosyltransferase